MLHDHRGWYVTFTTANAAKRVEMVHGFGGAQLLANRSVSISVHGAPKAEHVRSGMLLLANSSEEEKMRVEAERVWNSPQEVVDEAERLVLNELRSLLEKDITDRVVGVHIRKMIAEERSKRERERETGVVAMRPGQEWLAPTQIQGPGDGKMETERRGLKGLSFRKRKLQEVVVSATVHAGPTPEPEPGHELEGEAEAEPEPEKSIDTQERPRKRLKRAVAAVRDDDLEGVGVDSASPTVVESIHRRTPSPIPTVDVPVAKRAKDDDEDIDVHAQEDVKEEVVVEQPKKKKAEKKGTAKRSSKKAVITPEIENIEELVVSEPLTIDVPAVAEVRVSPTSWAPSASPPLPSAVIIEVKSPITPRINTLPDPVLRELVDDGEDLYFTKVALSMDVKNDDFSLSDVTAASSDPDEPPPFRKHVTGSARTEGYYKISHAEKSAYVAQYVLRGATAEGPTESEPAPQVVMSSRSNRANARRRAQGLEEINQLQLAVALSKGETGAADVVKFNQLQTRKKHLRFARSPIHDWGLYAMEKIARGEMVIEYVGEVIRAAVADKREKAYERQGIGSSYLFRIDEDLVVDATKKGNLGYVLVLVLLSLLFFRTFLTTI